VIKEFVVKMPIVEQSSRPFEQSEYNSRNFKPNFEGFHYKFSVLVPTKVIRNGKKERVFLKTDLKKLNALFDDDFGGYTRHKVEGEWINPQKEIIVNEHMRYEIYSKRNEKAIEYFRELKENLELYKKEDVIVIEQTEVTFMPTFSYKVRNLLRKIKQLEDENKRLKRKDI